ncbi:MAG: hypothetical protein ACUVQ1_04475 [Candidatus Kapaibacteriales bacterium]
MKLTNVLVVKITLILTSCTSSVINYQNEIVFPDSNISFQRHVLPVVKSTCGLSYCHGEVFPQSNVMIYDYFTLMTSYNGALVIPKNPDASVLMQIIEFKLPHNPFLRWNLNDNQRIGIRRWILEGAINN